MQNRDQLLWILVSCVFAVGAAMAISYATGPADVTLSREHAAQLSKSDQSTPLETKAVSGRPVPNNRRNTIESVQAADVYVIDHDNGEHGSGDPLDVICTLNRFTASSVWLSSAFGAGDKAKVWYDPSLGSPNGCGPSPYPFRVDSVWLAFQVSAPDTFIFSVEIECPIIPGDSCSGPGEVIWADTFMVVFAPGTYPGGRAIKVPTPGACVNGPFFVGSELIYWGGTSAQYWPSFRWGNDGDSTVCTQWLCDATGCSEWRDVWPQANWGKMQWWVKGNTQDACTPITCTLPEPCDVTCPGSTPPEGEPNCGPQYVDNYNGGCNANPPVFQDINCGQTICGTSGTYIFTDTTQHNYRDTDWYRIVTTTQGQITWRAVAEFPLLMFIISPNGPGCDNYTLIASASADSCDTASVVSPCVDAGTYWLWIGPSVFEGVPCGKPYWASAMCGPCPLGRCCYGNDPSSPQCANNNQAQCTALGGTWTQGQTCAGNPCPPHLACQTGPVMETQPPHNDDEIWTGVVSEAGRSLLAYDDFSGLTQPAASIRFWGLNAVNTGSWAACNEDPTPFVIRFYPDSASFPASTPTCTYNATLNRTATTESYANFPLWEYTTALTPPCNITDGWVSIQGAGDTTCWFLWASSPFGNARSLQRSTAGWTEHNYDHGMCLAASPCDTSMRADSVTVSLAPGNTNTRVRFRAPQAGTYLIYSTADKNAEFPGSFSLEPTGTVNVPAGYSIWVDPAATIPYKRYVVVHYCP